jgi:hypothetical protein
VNFSFADDEPFTIEAGRALSAVPFVRVEQRLRRAVRAFEVP